jgi:hypothetical protein
MKHCYPILSLLFLLITAGNLQAQCTLSLSVPDTAVCEGSMLNISAVGMPSVVNYNQTTTFAAGNNHRGNMFDLYATNTLTITSFDAHPMGSTNIAVYYRTTPYAGFETTSSGWIYLGAADVIAQPYGTPTPVPLPINVTIPAGQTYSFYVTSTNTGVSLNYTDGASEGATYSSDANLTFRQGVGMEYPFTNGTGGVFRPRVWNGVIHYTVPVPTTYDYLWNTTETTQSISPTVNESTTYTVQLNMTGCPTLYDTLNVLVSTPPVDAGADATICSGDSIALNGSGAVSYSWDNGISDGVLFAPAASQDYIVTATDSIGCAGTDTVAVTVNALPLVSAGSDIGVCDGSMAVLSGSGAQSYTWDNGIADGQPFQPTDTMAYVVTGTDNNNCVNTDTVTVYLYPLPAIGAGNDVTVCSGDEITLQGTGGQTYVWSNGAQDGVAFQPLQSEAISVIGTDANNCQSSDTMIVTVNDVDTGVSYTNGITLTADATGAVYQWYDCATQNPIAGETGQTFIAAANGSYAVEVTENGCTQMSGCMSVSVVGLATAEIASFVLYPNPAEGLVTISTTAPARSVELLDVNGKVLLAIVPETAQTQIGLDAFVSGVYFVRVALETGVQTEKLVVKH